MSNTENNDIMYGQYVVPHYNDMVKFNVGQPSPSILPLDIVKKGMQYTMSITDPSLLQYGNIPGYDKFRECFSDFLSKKYNSEVYNNELFITNGITHGITFICSLFLKTGSTIYVEEPTYFLAINIFKELGMKIVPIPIESDGINLEKLEEAIEMNGDSETHMLYTIPTFHNPTSYTMSSEKRSRLSQIAEKYNNFMILADEVYQLLYFEDNAKPSLPLCYYSPKAISLGSFSKILAPGLRMGWIHTKNKDYMKKMLGCGQFDSSGGCSPFVQSIIHGIISSGDLDNNIIKCREFLKTNCLYMSKVIKEKLNDYVDFIVPSGGYFLWLKIKDGIDVNKLLSLMEKYKITVSPGTRFSAYGECKKFIRLSFSYYDFDGINVGVERLCKLFEYVKLFSNKTFIAVNGFKGKLGTKICEAINKHDNLQMIEGIDRNYSLEQIDLYSVIIDVSSPEGTRTLITKLNLLNRKVPLVIGTTGDLPMDLIEEYAKNSPVALVSNFSLGIPELISILKNINKKNWDISMVEKHHIHKKDAPSGTAKTLKNVLNQDVPIESVREGEIIGEHCIMLKRDDEEIIIEHKAKNRDLFANGAVNYATWIVKQQNGLYYNMC
jgi:2-aminoadipate transaminase